MHSNHAPTARLVSAAAILLGTALALTACSTAATSSASADCDDTYTIGFSHPVGESAFAKALKGKVEDAAADNGCVSVLLDNTQSSDLESQRATIESWVTQKVDAIVVLAVDATALDGLREQAQAQGTKWLTYAGGTDTSDGSVGFDNVQSGDLVADDALAWVAENYPDGGITAEVTTLTPLVGFKGRWEQPLAKFEEAGWARSCL